MIGRGIGVLLLLLAAGAGLAVAADPVPAADCAACHEETVAAFAAGPHGRRMAARSAELFESSCEICHGSAAEHIDDMTPETIRAQAPDMACITCHSDAATSRETITPGHGRQGVSCLDCHQAGHRAEVEEPLLAKNNRELCGNCHLPQANAFRLPYAHRNGTEPFDCTACHTAHAWNRVGRLSLAAESTACADCHIATVRPQVFPHPPSGHAQCVACHVPHGSPNPRQLTRPTVHLLCLECHTNTPAFHDVTGPRYRNCQNCHAAVHGSNRDPLLFEE